MAARDLRCQKSSFLTLQRFLFDFFNLLEFFFILQKKTPFMTIIFRWTIQNIMVDYAMLLLFLIQNLSSSEKLFFYHFFAIVFSWKQLPLKLLFRKLWNWSPETNSSKYSTLWNEFEWNQLKIVYFSLRRKANKFEWKKKTKCVNESADHRPYFVMTHNNEYIHNSSALPHISNCLFYLTSW